jgi:uncharacterized protein YegP (UPF0339 family)
MSYPKYQVYKDKSGKFLFRLFAANAKNILHSEGYNTKAACLNGIASVKRNASNKARFVTNKAKCNNKVYFNLIAGNNQVVGTSKMYTRRQSIYKGRNSVMKNAKSSVLE